MDEDKIYVACEYCGWSLLRDDDEVHADCDGRAKALVDWLNNSNDASSSFNVSP